MATVNLVEALRERADWLKSRSFASDGTVERAAAYEIIRLRVQRDELRVASIKYKTLCREVKRTLAKLRGRAETIRRLDSQLEMCGEALKRQGDLIRQLMDAEGAEVIR